MFSNIEINKEMLEGSYKKLKSYYHYNKNFVFMKRKIANFEYDETEMNNNIKLLSQLLVNIQNDKYQNMINQWLENIDFFVMPKAFKEKSDKSQMVVADDFLDNKPVSKVNFFIDMPIELHLLETLWTVIVGKIVHEKGLISDDCYGNSIDNQVLYNRDDDFITSINFSKNKLFKIYFSQYCEWKNRAIESVERAHKLKKDTALFSLDIKSYYYSVNLKFENICIMLENDSRYEQIAGLTNVIEKIYTRYTQLIGTFRELKHNVFKKEVMLPIGLFSSMLIANLYLSKFDKQLQKNNNILYYGRYVDDILILIDISNVDKNGLLKGNLIDDVLVEKNKILQKITEHDYCINEYINLQIQKEKVKVIYFEGGGSHSLINQLKKTIKIPSQMNIVPDPALVLTDFEEAAYVIRNFTNETKIREIGQLEVDRFQLGWYLSQIVQTNKVNKRLLNKKERENRQKEAKKIMDFFLGSKCLEYSSNWINVLYFYLLIEERGWFIQFKNNVRFAIKSLRTDHIEGIVKGKDRAVKAKMKSCLTEHFNICVSSALSVHPKFDKKEKNNSDLALKIRKVNLFNHYLVSFPLINYADSLDDNLDLTKITMDDIQKNKFRISSSKKTKWSPRFIKLDEIFEWVFLVQACKGGNFYVTDSQEQVDKKLKYIENFFYKVNNINSQIVKPLALSIENKKIIDKYTYQYINLGENRAFKKEVKVAIANIKTDTKMCADTLGNKEMLELSRSVLDSFLIAAYNGESKPVDFLLFPEFYMPVEWISDILSFARKTGITIITGVQYITCRNKYGNQQAHNNIAVMAPFTTGRYQNAFLLVREKNDYAPMEKELLALKNYTCENQQIPNYQVFRNNGIDYGTFLCYEFTDIMARGFYKNQVDMLFTPEHNRDTSYFSSIIETTTRDLHTFVIQANTSIYGDSRITGPYGKNDRNIVQIKGGDVDNVIIGTINLREVVEYQLNEGDKEVEKIDKYFKMKKAEKYEFEQNMYKESKRKIAKTSARHDAYRLKEK